MFINIIIELTGLFSIRLLLYAVNAINTSFFPCIRSEIVVNSYISGAFNSPVRLAFVSQCEC